MTSQSRRTKREKKETGHAAVAEEGEVGLVAEAEAVAVAASEEEVEDVGSDCDQRGFTGAFRGNIGRISYKGVHCDGRKAYMCFAEHGSGHFTSVRCAYDRESTTQQSLQQVRYLRFAMDEVLPKVDRDQILEKSSTEELGFSRIIRPA